MKITADTVTKRILLADDEGHPLAIIGPDEAASVAMMLVDACGLMGSHNVAKALAARMFGEVSAAPITMRSGGMS